MEISTVVTFPYHLLPYCLPISDSRSTVYVNQERHSYTVSQISSQILPK